ncbi:MAG: hypothetical protein J1E80_06445, partial [Desulfovibrionaceae bacterium]|nr:hypothetical protein [Desulfovibrionaceae bacterium]
RDGEWLVVEVKAQNMMDDRDVLAKKAFAEDMLKASRISYHMVAHTDAAGWKAVRNTQMMPECSLPLQYTQRNKSE